MRIRNEETVCELNVIHVIERDWKRKKGELKAIGRYKNNCFEGTRPHSSSDQAGMFCDVSPVRYKTRRKYYGF